MGLLRYSRNCNLHVNLFKSFTVTIKMNESKDNKPSDRWLNEGMALVITPALAYYFAFTYESAYCNTFNIPVHFIRPDITTVLVYATILFGLYFILIPVFDVLADAVTFSLIPINNIWVRLLKLFFPLLMFFGLILVIYKEQWKTLIPITLIFIGIFLVDILVAWLFRDKTKSFAKQLDTGIELFFRSGTPLCIIRSRFGAKVTTVLFLIIVGIIVSRSLGNAAALNQKVFLMPSSHPNTVVLRQYGDKIICSPIDMDKKKVTKSFIIMTVGSDSNTVFELREVGPLQPEK